MNLNSIRNGFRKFFLGGSGLGGSVYSWLTPGQWGKKKYLEQYKHYAYSVISAIAEDAAKVNFEVFKNNTASDTPVIRHPFLELMKKPNPMMSQFQFLELHFTFMKLAGESYWYLAKGETTKKPRELYLLRPDLVQVVIDKNDPRGLVSGYVLNYEGKAKQTFEADEIMHFKMPNPLNPYYGYGTIEAAKIYLETEEFASRWTRNSLYNSGRPSGVLNIKGTVNVDEFNKLKRQFKQEYEGADNAGKTLIINDQSGVEYSKMGMELGEVAMKDLKDMTRDDIMVMFRVSKTMLGITDDVNLSNSRDARAVFTENIIKPELDRFIDHLNAFLMPVWGDGFTLSYEDPSMVSEAEQLEGWDKGWNRWLTSNDIRRDMGLDPIQGGDSLYRSITDVAVATDTPPKKSLKKKEIAEVDKYDVFEKEFFRVQEVYEKKYAAFMVDEFKRQEREILAKHQKQSATGWGFNVDAADGRIQGTLVPYGIELMKQSAKAGFRLAGDAETELNVNQRLTEYINDRVTKFAKNTNELTIQKLDKSIADGLANGEGVAELRKRVETIYDQATRGRAQTIARTESLAASNEGALAAYRQSPLVTAMEWRVAPDCQDACLTLDGKIIDIEANFVNNGGSVEAPDGSEFVASYGSVDHPPLHPNCRCTIVPSTKAPTVNDAPPSAESGFIDFSAPVGNNANEPDEIVRSEKEAREFAKGSDITDTLFHGGPADQITEFKTNGMKPDTEGLYGNAIYFSTDKTVAQSYGSDLITAKVNVKNVKVFTDASEMYREARALGFNSSKEFMQYISSSYDAVIDTSFKYIAIFKPKSVMMFD